MAAGAGEVAARHGGGAGARVQLCARCGVAAPEGEARCGVCDATLRGRRRALEAEAPAWVALRARFQCRQCLKSSPLDELVEEAEIRCLRCGLVQAFDPSSWQEVLEAAHAVADLSGGPEGRVPGEYWFGADNPHRELGLRQASTTLRQEGVSQREGLVIPRVLVAELRPGRPLCDHCHAPLQLASSGQGELRLRCPDDHAEVHTRTGRTICGQSAALVGVYADAHRVSQEAPEGLKLSGQDRVGCSSCGAPLPATGRERLLRCDFCGARTHVAAPVRHQLQEDPEPDTLWLLFEGPSHLRRVLQRDFETWDEDAAHHREVHDLKVAPRPLPAPLAWTMAWGAPAAATALGALVLLAWIAASVAIGLPLPQMDIGP